MTDSPTVPSRLKNLRFSKPIDMAAIGELTDEERETIRAKARDMVAKERKKAAEEAFLQKSLQEERHRVDPDESLDPIFLELAPNTEYLMLDGTKYFANETYYVTPKVWSVLCEQMNRGWAHDEQTQVRDENGQTRSRMPAHMGTGNFVDRRGTRGPMRVAGLAGMNVAIGRQQGAMGV